jgi:hypothetical protein
MKMNYSYNEMKRAFECGRNFQLTGENNFKELIEELNQALPQADVSGWLPSDCYIRNKIGCHCIDECEYKKDIEGNDL